MSITITPPPITKPLDMEGKRIYNLGAPVADNDAARKIDTVITVFDGSLNIGIDTGTGATITLHAKAFFPNIYKTFSAWGVKLEAQNTADNITNARFAIRNDSGTSGWIYLKWKYIA
jgi:hypothetical protein